MLYFFFFRFRKDPCFETGGEWAEVTGTALFIGHGGTGSLKGLHLPHRSTSKAFLLQASNSKSSFSSANNREKQDFPPWDVSSISLASLNPRGEPLTLWPSTSSKMRPSIPVKRKCLSFTRAHKPNSSYTSAPVNVFSVGFKCTWPFDHCQITVERQKVLEAS